MAEKRYQVLCPVFDGERRYEPGEEIVLDIATDDPLLSDGVIKPASDAQDDKVVGDRPARLMSAIGDLAKASGGPDGDNPQERQENLAFWTKSGKPKTEALEAICGLEDISAAERDAAWEAYLSGKEDQTSGGPDGNKSRRGDSPSSGGPDGKSRRGNPPSSGGPDGDE